MMDAVSGEGIFFVVEPHEYDVESIDQIDSENGRDGRDLSAGYDGKGSYHERDEHRPGFPEKHMRLYVIEPTDEYGWDENRKTEQHEYGVCL